MDKESEVWQAELIFEEENFLFEFLRFDFLIDWNGKNVREIHSKIGFSDYIEFILVQSWYMRNWHSICIVILDHFVGDFFHVDIILHLSWNYWNSWELPQLSFAVIIPNLSQMHALNVVCRTCTRWIPIKYFVAMWNYAYASNFVNKEKVQIF